VYWGRRLKKVVNFFLGKKTAAQRKSWLRRCVKPANWANYLGTLALEAHAPPALVWLRIYQGWENVLHPEGLTSSGVTRVGVTWGGNWRCHPYIFLQKKPATFFSRHHRLSAITSTVCLFSPERLTTFFCSSLSLLFISLGCHPLPPGGCHLPRFFTCPT